MYQVSRFSVSAQLLSNYCTCTIFKISMEEMRDDLGRHSSLASRWKEDGAILTNGSIWIYIASRQGMHAPGWIQGKYQNELGWWYWTQGCPFGNVCINILAYNVDWTAITIEIAKKKKTKKNCQKSVLLKKGDKSSSCTDMKLTGLSLELKRSKDNLLFSHY